MPKIEIMPSILAADMGNLEAAVRQCEQAGADQIHLDIMDGVFVPNISMGPAVVEMVNRVTDLPLDVHLMLIRPQEHIEAFAKAGADTILIHIEADCDVEDTLQKIRDLGCKAGITVNPPTPVDSIFQTLITQEPEGRDKIFINTGYFMQSFRTPKCWTSEGGIIGLSQKYYVDFEKQIWETTSKSEMNHVFLIQDK